MKIGEITVSFAVFAINLANESISSKNEVWLLNETVNVKVKQKFSIK